MNWDQQKSGVEKVIGQAISLLLAPYSMQTDDSGAFTFNMHGAHAELRMLLTWHVDVRTLNIGRPEDILRDLDRFLRPISEGIQVGEAADLRKDLERQKEVETTLRQEIADLKRYKIAFELRQETRP